MYQEVENIKVQFGKQLKQKLIAGDSPAEIGKWCYCWYLNYPDIEDKDFLELLLQLSAMELGEEFTFLSYELNQIADDLVKID